jgi:hypothetical protein
MSSRDAPEPARKRYTYQPSKPVAVAMISAVGAAGFLAPTIRNCLDEINHTRSAAIMAYHPSPADRSDMPHNELVDPTLPVREVTMGSAIATENPIIRPSGLTLFDF